MPISRLRSQYACLCGYDFREEPPQAAPDWVAPYIRTFAPWRYIKGFCASEQPTVLQEVASIRFIRMHKTINFSTWRGKIKAYCLDYSDLWFYREDHADLDRFLKLYQHYLDIGHGEQTRNHFFDKTTRLKGQSINGYQVVDQPDPHSFGYAPYRKSNSSNRND
jgi:hypothetical protein